MHVFCVEFFRPYDVRVRALLCTYKAAKRHTTVGLVEYRFTGVEDLLAGLSCAERSPVPHSSIAIHAGIFFCATTEHDLVS